MKNILKYYLPLAIFFLSLGLFFLIYSVQGHLAVLKYFAGESGLEGKGKIISKQLNAVVKEDGIEQDQIKLFEDQGKIYMVFQKTAHPGFSILIIDKDKKDIFTPLVSSSCYGLVFSSYLFQAECGQRGDYYGGEQHGSYPVKMELNDSQVNFQLPVYNYGRNSINLDRERRFEIIFKGE